jgi:hypothetical protein
LAASIFAVELAPCIDADVAGRHRNRRDTLRAARIGGIHRVLGEDDRVVVREGDAAAVVLRAAAAMAAGDAESCSVSISRDLEMSQFWQNLQARLQPAVPNDSTFDPG